MDTVMSKKEFECGYVYAHYPCQTGYAYRAEFIPIEAGLEIMEMILEDVSWIEDNPNGHPILHMKDGRELYVDNTEDFPVPTSEEVD